MCERALFAWPFKTLNTLRAKISKFSVEVIVANLPIDQFYRYNLILNNIIFIKTKSNYGYNELDLNCHCVCSKFGDVAKCSGKLYFQKEVMLSGGILDY